MGTDSPTDERIDLPPDFADHLAVVSNLETPPETMAEYWSGFADQLAASDRTINPEDLYTEDPTRRQVPTPKGVGLSVDSRSGRR